MIAIDEYRIKVDETVAYLKEKVAEPPSVAIVLGTGLAGLVESIENKNIIPYAKIPNFPQSTVEGHPGNLIFGQLSGKTVGALQGRFHFYEGYSTKELTFPVRVLSQLGAKLLLVTNAAGGLNTSFAAGTIMIIRDHLNFIPENPLRGPNVDEWGPRFPDLSEPYDLELVDTALASAEKLQLDNVTSGVYAAIPGPSLETPAETRFLKNSGADGVGMSSVPEVIVGKHAGMRILGISAVANVNDPDNFKPILLEDILEMSRQIEPQMQHLIKEVLAEIQ
jgi:purine-nucleoside phosphorylase